MAILTELRDPRVKGVTVLGAEVPTDLRAAKVIVSVMGEAKDERLAMQGLESARGFLQRKVGDRLDLRFVPELSFKLDRGLKNAAETARLLREVHGDGDGDGDAVGAADDADARGRDEPEDTVFQASPVASGESSPERPPLIEEPDETDLHIRVPPRPPESLRRDDAEPDETDDEIASYDPPEAT